MDDSGEPFPHHFEYPEVLQELEQSATYSNNFLKKFCPNDEKFSCEKDVSSKASKLLGIISMSDTGLTYFAQVREIFDRTS